ncbi:MAG TPA: hypothetical protein VFN30_01215 [Chitinophagaceae bacterium]|nr:hypothetical protein [Chitinophagaceae bacterium]
MNINRNNYEEFLLLYADNELTSSDRQIVENFLESNPDLKAELQLLVDTKLPAEPVFFNNKSVLYKKGAFVTAENYESYFLLYADNELSPDENVETEKFAASSPQLQKEFDLIQLTKSEVDKTIVFANKSVLYKREEPSKIIRISWLRISAAAVTVGFILYSGFLFLNKKSTHNISPIVKKQTLPASNNSLLKENPGTGSQTPAANKNTAVAANITHTQTEKLLVENKQNQSNPLVEKTAVVNLNVKENKKQKIAVTNQVVNTSDLSKTEENKIMTQTLEPIKATASIGTNNLEKVLIKATSLNALKPVEIIDTPVGSVTADEYASTASYKDEEKSNTSLVVFAVNDENVQKSGLRGLFRKVKRAVGRFKNNDEEKNKQLSIGAFSIALAR